MASLRGAGSDVASLGTRELARSLAFRDRAVFFPNTHGISHYPRPLARPDGGGNPRAKLAGPGLLEFSKTPDAADSGSMLRSDVVRDPGGRFGHP